MLTIHIDKCEEFNELTSEFIIVPETTLQLEHSLISISKWESKWHKAFLRKNNNKTREEVSVSFADIETNFAEILAKLS